MKRIAVILLTMALAIALFGCGAIPSATPTATPDEPAIIPVASATDLSGAASGTSITAAPTAAVTVFDETMGEQQLDLDGDGEMETLRVDAIPESDETVGGRTIVVTDNGTEYAAETVEARYMQSLTAADFDGDGKADPAVYRDADGAWSAMLSGAGYTPAAAVFGGAGWRAVPADYDGDYKADPGIYNIHSGAWQALLSGAGYAPAGTVFGGENWLPLPADYDGDGKADLVVFYSVTGQWRALLSGAGYAEAGAVFGSPGWQPLR